MAAAAVFFGDGAALRYIGPAGIQVFAAEIAKARARAVRSEKRRDQYRGCTLYRAPDLMSKVASSV